MKTKYNKHLRKLLILLIVIVFFGANYKEVRADIVVSQFISTDELTNGSTHYQNIGTGYNFTLKNISFYAKWNSGNKQYLDVRVYECSDSDYDDCVLVARSNDYNSQVEATTKTLYTEDVFEYDETAGPYTEPFVFNATKYYRIDFNGAGNGGSSTYYGSEDDVFAGGNCYLDCEDMMDYYFFIQDTSGVTYIPIKTEFTSVTPYNDEILEDPNINFEANWYITDDDLDNLNSFFGLFDGFVRIQVRAEDPFNSSWSCQIYTEDFENNELTTNFSYNFDGSNSTCPNADYNRDYKLIWTLVGSNSFNIVQFQISTTTYFTIGTTENEGNVSQYVASTTAENLSDYANGYSLNACNPLSGDFNIIDCLLSLFYPDKGYVSRTLGKQFNMLATAFPLGYITDFVSIMSTSTVATLSIIEWTIPNGIPGAGGTGSLPVIGVLDPLLNATTSQFITSTENDTRSFYDITSDYWNIVVSVMFVLYLATRILGNAFGVDYSGGIERVSGGRSRIFGISGNTRKGSNAELTKFGLIKGSDGIIRKKSF